jgi:hypothetical protein
MEKAMHFLPEVEVVFGVWVVVLVAVVSHMEQGPVRVEDMPKVNV